MDQCNQERVRNKKHAPVLSDGFFQETIKEKDIRVE